MQEKKDFIKVVLLSIVTCGIYEIIFLYEYDRDLRPLLTSVTKKPPEFLLFFVLSLLTCGLFMYYWYYCVFEAQAAEAAARGVALDVEEPLVMTLCMIIPIFKIYLLCENFNKLLAQ